jgi:serpin B
MVVLLPRERDGLAALEDRLTPENLDRWTDRLWEVEVRVTLPRFEISYPLQLNEPLQALGIVDAFGDGADFTGMDSSGMLYLAAALHKAFVAVDEEGTEAAAATAAVMALMGLPPPPPEFCADHPFLFLIRERGTGSVLFVGRVAHPPPGQPGKKAKPPARQMGMGEALARLAGKL